METRRGGDRQGQRGGAGASRLVAFPPHARDRHSVTVASTVQCSTAVSLAK